MMGGQAQSAGSCRGQSIQVPRHERLSTLQGRRQLFLRAWSRPDTRPHWTAMEEACLWRKSTKRVGHTGLQARLRVASTVVGIRHRIQPHTAR
jgi:hypothetical protein